jgi:hypothetical protein
LIRTPPVVFLEHILFPFLGDFDRRDWWKVSGAAASDTTNTAVGGLGWSWGRLGSLVLDVWWGSRFWLVCYRPGLAARPGVNNPGPAGWWVCIDCSRRDWRW